MYVTGLISSVIDVNLLFLYSSFLFSLLLSPSAGHRKVLSTQKPSQICLWSVSGLFVSVQVWSGCQRQEADTGQTLPTSVHHHVQRDLPRGTQTTLTSVSAQFRIAIASYVRYGSIPVFLIATLVHETVIVMSAWKCVSMVYTTELLLLYPVCH